MKNLFYLSICLLYLLPLKSQISITASNGIYARLTPTMGINGNARYNCKTFTHGPLVDSTKKLNPSVIRYPAGLPSNEWDWQTGAIMTSTFCQGPSPCPVTYKHDELKIALDSCNADMLYTPNVFHSTISYQMQGINYAASLGIPIKYIELGNEQNLPGCQKLGVAGYTTTVKAFADTVKSHYPNSKIALVGGNTGITGTAAIWVPSIASGSINFDAFAHHIYADGNNSDGIFHFKRAIANSYSITGSRYFISSYTTMPTKEVWVTEYNMSPTTTSGTLSVNNVLVNTWSHVLFVNAMLDTMLHFPKITMLFPWALTDNNSGYASLNNNNYQMRSIGLFTKISNDVSRGLDSCRQIVFNVNQIETYNGLNFSKLIGWKFYNSNKSIENSYFVNFSSSTFSLNINPLYQSQQIAYTQYYADTALLITNGLQNVTINAGLTSNTINIAPYSITIVKKQSSTAQNELTIEKDLFSIFPNPSESEVNIKINSTNFKYRLFNNLGQLIQTANNNSKIDLKDHQDGIYFIEIVDQTKNKIGYKKIVKQN